MKTKRKRPVPSAELVIRPQGGRAVARLTVGKVEGGYLITAVADDGSAASGIFGRAFRVEKIADGTVYHVSIATRDGATSSCECKGFMHHGHCKHVTGLAALVAAGEL